jgi:hypothetical protein
VAREPKLKVFCTPTAFYNALVAAPSQKAALKLGAPLRTCSQQGGPVPSRRNCRSWRSLGQARS